jgi:ParB family chromosome partitioning protein
MSSLRKLRITDVKVPKRHRRDFGDIESLADSMRDVGILQPIVVRPDLSLVAGERRLKAERDENTCRKDFLPTERQAIGADLEAWATRRAKERQKAGGKSAGRGRPKGSAKLAEPNGEARREVASALGIGHTTYAKEKAIVQAAKTDPKLFGDPGKSRCAVFGGEARGRPPAAHNEWFITAPPRQIAAYPASPH